MLGLLMIKTRILQEPLFAARVIYDLLFFFMVIIIVLNLIFGVIIDTFADLRSEKQKKEEILKTTCFICGKCQNRLKNKVRSQRQLHTRGSRSPEFPPCLPQLGDVLGCHVRSSLAAGGSRNAPSVYMYPSSSHLQFLFLLCFREGFSLAWGRLHQTVVPPEGAER